MAKWTSSPKLPLSIATPKGLGPDLMHLGIIYHRWETWAKYWDGCWIHLVPAPCPPHAPLCNHRLVQSSLPGEIVIFRTMSFFANSKNPPFVHSPLPCETVNFGASGGACAKGGGGGG